MMESSPDADIDTSVPLDSFSPPSTLATSTPGSNDNVLQLRWCFGFNKSLVNGVHSLSTSTRHAIVYTAAHTGIIYDYAEKKQRLLQGHTHPITSCSVSEDKRWIVTADTGENSLLVVWDAMSGVPVKTIAQPHANGVAALDISPDALYIATISAGPSDQQEKRTQQELSVWEWTAHGQAGRTPLYSSLIATEDVQQTVRFNPFDIRELVTNGKQRVIFWNWAQQKLLFYSPSLSQKDFRQVIGNFTQSIFVPDSSQALTGTDDGDIIVWDDTAQSVESSETSFPERRAVKIVRLVSGNALSSKATKVALTILTDMEGYLVVGSSDGAVRCYDFDFRLVAWFEDMNAGPVQSISFSALDEDPVTPSPKVRSGDGEAFDLPDFIVSTSVAFIVGMSTSLFGELEADNRRGTLLMQGVNDSIYGIAAHPQYDQVALGAYSGVIQLWNYVSKRLVMMRKFDPEKLRPQCLAFSPDGDKLVIGFTCGVVKIVHAQSLEDISTFRLSKGDGITDIRISPDSCWLAAVDTKQFVGLWKLRNSEASGDLDTSWSYIGRCRAHSKPITGIEFTQTVDGSVLLVSVAEDRTLVEYNLDRSSITDGIVITQNPIRIEQSGTPTTCCWHPNVKGLQEELVVIANDEYKLKQWNARSKTCRKTTLGPSYGGPINRLIPLGSDIDTLDERICAYSTHSKIIGLAKVPFDGNPDKCMGLIAHTGEISGLVASHDGKYLLSAGGEDRIVNVWEVRPEFLDRESDLGFVEAEDTTVPFQNNLDPYLSLLEGGKNGELHNEIVDYFYLAQLRVQGEDVSITRAVTNNLPIKEIPNVMRALGYYPTDQEIRHMCSEIKYSKFTEDAETVDSIDLEQFIKLYVNHRPVFGISKNQIENAFQVLGAAPSLAWNDIEKRLLNQGEHMSVEELKSCLTALLVENTGPEGEELSMQETYTAQDFADQILGFDDYDPAEEISIQQS